MTKLLTIAILFAACNDTPSLSTGTPPGARGPAGVAVAQQQQQGALTGKQPSVDPTVPSWTPNSCIAYHQAVVEALDCGAIAKGTRDQIQLAYGAASQRWKAEVDATPEKINAVAVACQASTSSVLADTAGKCPVTKG